MSKVLLFDFDGTIADSFENFIDIFNILSMKYNFLPITPEVREKFRSEDPRTLMKRLKMPLYKLPLIAHDVKKMQQQHIEQIEPYKNLPEVLFALKKQGYLLGIITSNAKENVEVFIKNNTIDIFDFIYSDTGLLGKDKVIHKFLKQHAIAKEDALYIGDEIRDIQACKKAGIKIIAVTWGFNSKEGLTKYHPEFLIDKPLELLQLLK